MGTKEPLGQLTATHPRAPAMGPTHSSLITHHSPMPTNYELMDAYRHWWRLSFGTTPNSQAVVVAAAWASHVLATYQDGQSDQAGEASK